MAEDRYGGYGRAGGWRGRDSSIFSDDDEDRRYRGTERWTGGRSRRDEERGFFERAGDEVRAWFGDEEAERRRELDMQRDDARYAFGSGHDRRYPGLPANRTPYGGFGRSDHGGASDDGRSVMFRRSQWDENYRRWRDQQIERFDREYEEYCRERQRRFDQDFDSWRNSRLTEGGATGAPATRGTTAFGGGDRRATERAGGTIGAPLSETASATTAGGGSASAVEASTGSSGGASAAGAGGENGEASRGRRARPRS